MLRKFLPILVSLLLTAGVLPAADTARYDVLLIMADDLRCALGCYGDKQAITPNIDRLARKGVLFERAYVQYPVCNPSRTSMLTSTRPERNGVTGNGTFFRTKMPDVVTLPQLYRQQGGKSLSYGKIYHAGLVEGEIEHGMLDAGKSWDDAKMFCPTKAGSTGPVTNLTGGTLPWCRVGAMEGGDDDQSDGQTAQHVIAAIKDLKTNRWFIGAGFHRPHDPFIVSKKYLALYPPDSLKLHRDPADASPLVPMAIGRGGFQTAFDKFTHEDQLTYLRHYYAGISQTDAQVGRLMETLDTLKLWDQTVVIFVGDHGYHIGERNWWNKGTLFELSCRAPCIIVAPGIKPAVCRSLIEFMDIYPTITELCGLKAPVQVEGKSLVPLLKDPTKSVRDDAVTHLTRGPKSFGFSMRTDRWRYTEWSDGRAELYDHDSDPGEWHNLADDEKHSDTRKTLAQRLKELTSN